ncbi:hypothetical protein IC607_00885 [Cellulomonas sp. JH27-2]|uniref:hypothetical protein n=1 Tax=Cellulomonas sp. JH27-2 TaxID=2774139 RepID=UPI00177F048C|nr:hypothetical protein [Cellulomonas sp. JH27-2]MBD8057524.1 hypothetical protein [Cellulomonas sp. JH27-2]
MTAPFPPGCPPEEAIEVDRSFYRLAEKRLAVGAATGPNSWLRPYETPGSPLLGRSDLPEAHGLSVIGDMAELTRARDMSPWMAKKSVAEVRVTPQSGRVQHTPSRAWRSHHDWWTDPHDLVPLALVVEAARY